MNLSTPYSQNPRSMMSYEYKSVFFVCQKPNLSNSSKIGKSVVNDEVS